MSIVDGTVFYHGSYASVEIDKTEFTMELLAAMAVKTIAKEKKISRVKALSKFMVSKTGQMLFDASSGLWMNGPDYIAEEYNLEMRAKRRSREITY